MPRTGHMSARQGKRVLVVMRDGDHFVAKFKEHKDKVIHFSDHESVLTRHIRTVSLYRNQGR